MPLSSCFHKVSEKLCNVLHIVLTVHIMLGFIIVSIFSYVVWSLGQNKVPFSFQIFFDVKVVPLRQNSDALVVSEAQERHRFDKFARCSPLLFGQRRRHGERTLIYDILFVLSWAPAPAPVPSRDFPVFLSLSVLF